MRFLSSNRLVPIVVAASVISAVAACGSTIVAEDDDGGGGSSAGNGNGNGNGNGSPGNQGSQASNPSAGTAGPGGVGGADTGPSTGQSSQGATGPGCLYVEQSDEYCYKHSTCTDLLRETECEETQAEPGKCWCFIEGEFVAECVNEDSYCNVGANGDCCARVWPR